LEIVRVRTADVRRYNHTMAFACECPAGRGRGDMDQDE
jgi:hypothetical protein